MGLDYANGNVGSEDGEGATIAAGAINAVAGRAIAVVVTNYTSPVRSVSSIADTAGNTFNSLGSAYINGYVSIEFWLAENISGNASNVVTATFSANAFYRRIFVLQLTGAALSGAHNADFAPAGNVDSASPYATTAANTSVDGEMVIGVCLDESGGLTYSSSSPSIFRLQVSDGAVFTNLIATAGSGNAAVAGSGNSAHWCYSKAIKPASNPSFTITETLSFAEALD